MGRSDSKREKRAKSKRKPDAASSLEHGVTAQSQSEAAGDELSADNYLPRLTHPRLLQLIDFSHGLLDELITVGVIKREKYEPFRLSALDEINYSEKRAQIMNDVINASAEQKEKFLSALDRTQQSHITNYIRHNGRRPADTDDNWPSFDGYNAIAEHYTRLLDLIDIKCGLLDELISAGFFNDRQRAAVMTDDSTNRSKVRELLRLMLCTSVAGYKTVIDCLVKTKQFLVVSMLDPSTAATYPPLNDDNRAKLDSSHSALVELIDTRHSGLLEELRAMNCLTFRQKEYIEYIDKASARTRRLLDILRRGSQSDYDKFIACLDRTKQRHVAKVLSADRAVAVSMITAHGTEVDKNERDVIEAFLDLLQKSTADRQEELLMKDVRSVLGPDNELIFMKRTQSITLFIASRSMSGLTHLYDMYSNGQIKSIVQHIFSALLQNKHDVIIDELTWDRSNYFGCMKHLSEASDLSFYPEICRFSSGATDTEPPGCSSLTDRFPHELIELLLLKAACQLFVIMKVLTTNAATYTHVTLSAVCRYWWQTLICRRSNTRRLRRYFTHLCRPFSFNQRSITSLQIGRKVTGVVEFDGKLYVANGSYRTIDVYEVAGSSSYHLVDCIKVPGSVYLLDVNVCGTERCLFVSDRDARCIWRVNFLTDSNAIDMSPLFANLQYMPYSLSVQSERLLVTASSGDALYVYKINDVERSQRVNLPDYMLARHAVETSRGTFVVAHVSKDPKSGLVGGVSELSADGHFLRVYKGPPPFSWPFYITNVNDHYLVSDHYNRRILQMNADLELTQVLIADLHSNPLRHCYCVETGKLYVTDNSNTVTVYSV